MGTQAAEDTVDWRYLLDRRGMRRGRWTSSETKYQGTSITVIISEDRIPINKK